MIEVTAKDCLSIAVDDDILEQTADIISKDILVISFEEKISDKKVCDDNKKTNIIVFLGEHFWIMENICGLDPPKRGSK